MYDRANRLLQASEDYRYKAESAVSAPLYATGDVAGRSMAKPLAASFEGEELELGFDGRSASVGVDLRESRLVYELILTPAAFAHGVTPASVELYVSDTNLKGSYEKVEATVTIDGETGRIAVMPQAPVMTRYAKVHCIIDMRDENLAAAQASFTNLASGILRVGYYAQSSNALYTYDGQGNRLNATTTEGESRLGLSETNETSVYHLWDDSDRIKKIEKETVLENGTTVVTTWAYVYDALGNLSEKGDSFTEAGDAIQFSADSGHYVRYRYDLWNRLGSVEKGGAGTDSAIRAASYEYDPTGLRIRKVTSTVETQYVYGQDGNVLRETRDESGKDAVTMDYVYALGKLAGWTETIGAASTKYWATTDHLGSVTAATDSGGAIAMRRDFSAFGDSRDAVLETVAGPRYTGKDYDEDAELYYFNARWYDAELARFTTEDPIKDGTNWYAYVNSRAMSYTDPTGNQPDAVNGLTDSQYRSQFANEVQGLPLKGSARVTTVPGLRECYYQVDIDTVAVRRISGTQVEVQHIVGVMNLQANPNHAGAYDLVPEQDDSVYAVGSGIARSSYDERYGYTIVVEQYNGVSTRYSHLQPLKTGEEYEIFKGDQLGIVGNTGISTGSHLDFRQWDTQSGKVVNLISDMVDQSYQYDASYIGVRERQGQDSEKYNIPENRPIDRMEVESSKTFTVRDRNEMEAL